MAVCSAALMQIQRSAEAVTAVASVVNAEFESAAERIATCPGRVITSAVGNSGAIAARMAHVWALCGIPAFFLDANQALHGSLGAITPGDVVVVLSKGGATEEVNEFARMSVNQGAFVIAVTSASRSPLLRHADSIQLLPSTDADYAAVVGMGSSLAQAAWGDALAVAVLTSRGVKRSDLEKRHPRGSVGEASRARTEGGHGE